MTNNGQFSGKVALVTGGGSGIGKATAVELGRQGASVGVLSRQEDRIATACDEVADTGGEALGIPADVSREADMLDAILTVKAALPLLKRQGGSIVVVSSVNGSRNFNYPGAVAYSTSKAGQVAFTKMVALELAQHNIRINVVCPGAIRTNIGEATHPRNIDAIRWPVEYPNGVSPLAGGPADPAQVARVIAFLLSDAADHVSGTEMWIDAAESLLVG